MFSFECTNCDTNDKDYRDLACEHLGWFEGFKHVTTLVACCTQFNEAPTQVGKIRHPSNQLLIFCCKKDCSEDARAKAFEKQH